MKKILRSEIKKIFRHLNVVITMAFYLFLLFVLLDVLLNISSDLVILHKGAIIPGNLVAEYNYFKTILDKPDTKQKTRTSGLNNFVSSEWPVMTLSLFCYGTRNLALANPAMKEDASRYMRKAIERLTKPEYYNFTVEHFGNPFSSKIQDNAFYLGHLAVALASYREVSGNSDYDELFHKIAAAFYENYKKSPTYCLDSYANFCWTSEQVVPLRALKIHDDIFGTEYSQVVYAWEKTMRKKFIERPYGILVTEIDKDTGEIYEGGRAIPNFWTILFLHDVLPDFCRELYGNTRKSLLIWRCGFPVFKEYPGKKQIATGDTGPIILGASVASTCFGMGSAAAMGDATVFRPLLIITDLVGLSFSTGKNRRYLAGGQVGTASFFLCKTMALTAPKQNGGFPPAKNVFFVYAILLLFIALICWRLYRLITGLRLRTAKKI